jgi:hypothetical protein
MTDDVSKLPAWPTGLEALLEYAQHKPECKMMEDRWQDECTCGLDALLAACVREES